jgi:hypothetical protein
VGESGEREWREGLTAKKSTAAVIHKRKLPHVYVYSEFNEHQTTPCNPHPKRKPQWRLRESASTYVRRNKSNGTAAAPPPPLTK